MKKEEIVARARMVGQQRNYIEREVERMMLSLMDLNNSLTTVQNMKDEAGLVPVGGGAFIRAKLDSKKVLIPVGANYLIEFEVEDAKAEIDARMKMTEKAIQGLRAELKKADDEFAKLENAYRGGEVEEEEGGGS